MKILFRLSLIILLLFAWSGVFAQITTSDLDKAYGLDPLLYNGKYYSYFVPRWTEGTQFLNGPDAVKGFVTKRGVTYDNLLLKYDVYNQQLILQYKTNTGADHLIIISDVWLEKFNLGDVHFEMLAIQDTLRRIYQVMGTGPIRALYSWSKKLDITNQIGSENHVFLPSMKESYLLIDTKLLKYKKNRSFVRLFDPAKQVVLKKYLRQHKIKVKKASNQVVTELINYCNTLSPK